MKKRRKLDRRSVQYIRAIFKGTFRTETFFFFFFLNEKGTPGKSGRPYVLFPVHLIRTTFKLNVRSFVRCSSFVVRWFNVYRWSFVYSSPVKFYHSIRDECLFAKVVQRANRRDGFRFCRAWPTSEIKPGNDSVTRQIKYFVKRPKRFLQHS